jgi:L-lactate dehydrogenase
MVLNISMVKWRGCPRRSCHPAFGVTLSLPTLIGRTGALAVLQPELSPDERIALEKSAEILRTAR